MRASSTLISSHPPVAEVDVPVSSANGHQLVETSEVGEPLPSEVAPESGRIQSYLTLIEQLLRCPVGEESQILQANLDLLDLGFIQVVTHVAAQAEQQGEADVANCLRQLADELQKAMAQALSLRTPAYMQVINALLLCPAGDEDQVLAAHQDLVDAGLVHLMGQTAGTLALQGEDAAANFLLNGGRQLAVQLGLAKPIAASSSPAAQGAGTEDVGEDGKKTAKLITDQTIQGEGVSHSEDEPKLKRPGGLSRRLHQLVNAFGRKRANASAVAVTPPRPIHEQASDGLDNPDNSEPLSDGGRVSQESGATARSNQTPDSPKRTDEVSVSPSLPYFLRRLLQVITDHPGNPTVVYGLLQAHPQALNQDSAIALRHWAKYTFDTEPADVTAGIAKDLTQLGTLCLRSPVGDRGVILALAIAAYESALAVITKGTQPLPWAGIQNNLAIAYSDRVSSLSGLELEQYKCSQSECLEQAIIHFHAALTVYTQDDYPQDWAMTQNNLALAYRDRRQGNPEENLERAITCHQAALQVYRPDTLPQAWAITQMNLAQAYAYGIEQGVVKQGETDYLSRAIAANERALHVFIRSQYPQQWSRIQDQLVALRQSQEQEFNCIAVKDNYIQFGPHAIAAPDLLPLLSRYELLPTFLAELVVDRAIASIPCTPEEERECLEAFHERQRFATLQKQHQWLQQRQLQESDLCQWATRALRLEKFKQQTWGVRVESYFLKHKHQLDQVIYKLLRHPDAALMQELYFRLQDGKECFAQLAQEYSQGPEAQSGGEVGPVELGHLPPSLATALIASTPQQILGPVQVGELQVIIQLERLIPARLDEAMRGRLVEEQFQGWLQAQIEEVLQGMFKSVH